MVCYMVSTPQHDIFMRGGMRVWRYGADPCLADWFVTITSAQSMYKAYLD